MRRSIADAKQLMVEAGYPNGRDAKTGKPLVLNYDFYAPATPERKPEIDWVVRQFAKIDIQLEVRATDNNQFQDKVRKGKYQVFWLGWNADYPDAENFMFLLYSKAGKTKFDGENTSNYDSAEYDRLFERMKSLDDGPEKQQLIDEMVKIVRDDAPWTMGFFPYASAAVQQWVHNSRPAILVRDQGRYLRLDVAQRVARQREWNRPSGGRDRPGRGACWRWCGWPGASCAGASAPTRAARCWREGRACRCVERRMLNFIVRRVVYGVFILLGVNLLTFMLFFTVNTPDDMARLNLGGKRVTQEAIEKWKTERGYDKPLYFDASRAGQ